MVVTDLLAQHSFISNVIYKTVHVTGYAWVWGLCRWVSVAEQWPTCVGCRTIFIAFAVWEMIGVPLAHDRECLFKLLHTLCFLVFMNELVLCVCRTLVFSYLYRYIIIHSYVGVYVVNILAQLYFMYLFHIKYHHCFSGWEIMRSHHLTSVSHVFLESLVMVRCSLVILGVHQVYSI